MNGLMRLLFVLSVFLSACRSGASSPWQTHEVSSGPMVFSLKETGELGSQKEFNVRVPFDGTLIQLADEGLVVKKGALLGKLDTSAQIQERDGAKLSLQEAQLDLKLAELDGRTEKARLASESAQAALQLKSESVRLKQLKEERDPVQEAQLKASLQSLKQRMEILELEARERARLFDLGYLSKTERDQAQVQLAEAKKEQERLEAELKVFEQGAREEELEKQALKRDKARESLQRIKKESQVQQRVAKVQARTAQVRIKRFKDRYEYYRDLVQAADLKAPDAGTVIYGKVRVGQDEVPVKAGDAVSEGISVVRLVDLEQPVIRLMVHEIDAPRLTTGQRAQVKVDAYPDKVLWGQVRSLLPVASQTLENDKLELQGFRCEITLDSADPDLRPGMTANVEIIIQELQDALQVPSQALIEHDGVMWCFVLEDGKAVPRQLELGQSNARMTQVFKGVKQGDTVILNPGGLKP